MSVCVPPVVFFAWFSSCTELRLCTARAAQVSKPFRLRKNTGQARLRARPVLRVFGYFSLIAATSTWFGMLLKE